MIHCGQQQNKAILFYSSACKNYECSKSITSVLKSF